MESNNDSLKLWPLRVSRKIVRDMAPEKESEGKSSAKALYTECACGHTHHKDIDAQLFTYIKGMTKFLHF